MPKSKKSEPTADDDVKALFDTIENGIKSGEFDVFIARLDDAITDRLAAVSAEEEKQKRATKKPAATQEKKVSPPPKKSGKDQTAKVTPKEKTQYRITDGLKKLAGATVEFAKFGKDDESKSVVIMVTDMPGAPKGKRISVPTNALEDIPKSASGPRRKKVTRKK